MPEEEVVEIKFRLYDGSDMGPFRYSPASTIAMLKERIVAEWPKDKKIAPKGANDIKLINAGKILENNKIVGQCRVHFGDLPEAVITMHVVVQPSVTKVKTEGWSPQFLGSAVLWTVSRDLDAVFLCQQWMCVCMIKVNKIEQGNSYGEGKMEPRI
ncbi:Membrane-anchored ubiquitin-fold 4 -like protein [Gossypium arboreum]|uniref:Membrane-anchored ubiquitin-fold 4-like protein n=1 Tax=Gossypium arboreum TaxID=29729 RepID=A0A0B0MT78_GOSAR|nr:Membrane-anchored ubiquitin-fold 4 -like protein [Gossypium arboreum]